ncbi:hypothetical protein HKD37_18G051328 [Glycine soja]
MGVFGVVLDHLWWRRNEYTFQQKWITNASLIVNIKALVHNFYNSKIVQLSLKMDGVSDMYCASTNKRHGSVTLNCDGAMSSEAMVASCGVRLDFCSVLEAKLWGIMYDLQMAAEAKMEHLHVAIDSLRAMMLIYDCMQFEGHNIASLLESEAKFQKLHLWPYWEK